MYSLLKYFSQYENVYTVILYLFCTGLLISSFEYLYISKEFKPQGIFSWKIFSSRGNYQKSTGLLKKTNLIFGYSATVSLHAARIISLIMLLVITDHYVKTLLLAFLFLTTLLLSYRTLIGLDGADQMDSILCITLLIVFLADNSFIYKTGLVFIAAQSVLSYLVAGTAKLFSKKWRNGVAVFQIMNTKTYGFESIAKLLSTVPRFINLLFCWHIILFEVLFLLVFFLPSPWFLIFLLWGICFHIYNAVAMGLNNFFWAFIATYPAIIYIHQLLVT